jgi:hypothetical protein
MKEESRIVEILSEILIENQGFNKRFDNNDSKLDKLIQVQEKQALAIGELRLSVMRLAEVIERFANYEERIAKLERIVLKQAS